LRPRGGERPRRPPHPPPAPRRARLRPLAAGGRGARPRAPDALPDRPRAAPRRRRRPRGPPGRVFATLVRGLSRRGLRRVRAASPRAPRRPLQLRSVSDAQPAGGGRPRPGNLSPSVPLRRPVHAGNPPPRLVVSDLEEHLPDL